MADRLEQFLVRCMHGLQVSWPSFRTEAEQCLTMYRSLKQSLELPPEKKVVLKSKKAKADESKIGRKVPVFSRARKSSVDKE